MYLAPRQSVAQDGINHVPLSNAASAILGVSMTFASMATISLFLRWYGARTGTGLIRWDFWFILAGTVSVIPRSKLLFLELCEVGETFSTDLTTR